ncbi:MAG: hypothetical protein RML12_05775 [Xanthomonadales bacterium]|nr:hypothetical protein [Xanthomonadales bacterium]
MMRHVVGRLVGVCRDLRRSLVGTARAQAVLERDDWFGACDNRGGCRLFGFPPPEDEALPWIGGEDEAVLELVFPEQGDPEVRLDAPAGAPPDRVWRLVLDGDPILRIRRGRDALPR